MLFLSLLNSFNWERTFCTRFSLSDLESNLNEKVCVAEVAVLKIDAETLRKEIKDDPVWGKMF